MEPISRRTVLAAGAAWMATPWACAAAAPQSPGRGAAPPLRREFRAAWVATVANIDWPSQPGLPASVQRSEISKTVAACARLGLNAILLQVRPTSDAIYRSDIEPWSAFLTGASGRPPRPDYDPLAVWIEEAHAAGLDLHAWVNPFRVRHHKSIGPDAANHVSKTRPEIVRKHGPYLWLDPGDPAAREYALNVTADLLRRYDLDGVHMDDYFYPYPRENEPFQDDATYARFGGGTPRSEWRRENINAFMVAMRALVREHCPGGLLTVSPFGIWRPDNPAGIKGFDAYEGLHADSRRWIREGWVDALMPQLYWKVDSPGQPFEPLLDWWRQQNPRNRHLWPGLYLTRVRPAGEEPSWEPSEIARQIEILRTKPDASGFALFSMIGLLDDYRGSAGVIGGLCDQPAHVPESPWAGGSRPATPTPRLESAGRTLVIEPGAGETPVRRWAVRHRRGSSWTAAALPPGERRLALPAGVEEAWVTAIGANGLASADARARG